MQLNYFCSPLRLGGAADLSPSASLPYTPPGEPLTGGMPLTVTRSRLCGTQPSCYEQQPLVFTGNTVVATQCQPSPFLTL